MNNFTPREESLTNIVISKNEFVLEISKKKKELEDRIRSFRQHIESPELLKKFDDHFNISK